jgi:hypothetical protein
MPGWTRLASRLHDPPRPRRDSQWFPSGRDVCTKGKSLNQRCERTRDHDKVEAAGRAHDLHFAACSPGREPVWGTLVLECVENALRSVNPQNSKIQPSDQPSIDPK